MLIREGRDNKKAYMKLKDSYVNQKMYEKKI